MIKALQKLFIFLPFFAFLNLAEAAQPLDGSIKSFNHAFANLVKSDGDEAEEWDIEIGKMIKTHPTNFLKALTVYRKKVLSLDGVVGNFGLDFVDDFTKHKEEVSLRIKALERAKKNIKDSEVLKVADECILELKNL